MSKRRMNLYLQPRSKTCGIDSIFACRNPELYDYMSESLDEGSAEKDQ